MKSKPSAISETLYIATIIAVMFLLGSMAYGVDRFVITGIVALFSALAGYCLGRMK